MTYEDEIDLDDDELRPSPAIFTQDCDDCGREWRGPEARSCPDCRSAGGPPSACFQCGSKMRWVPPGREAECSGCDARYPLTAVRTYRLGQLVERLAKESRTGSAEEVGKMILAAGRACLRRVQ